MVDTITTRLGDWRDDPIQLVGLLALAAAIAVFLWQLPHFLAGNSTIWPQYAAAFTDMFSSRRGYSPSSWR